MKSIPLYWIIVSTLTLAPLASAQTAQTQQLTGDVPVAIAQLNLQPLGQLPNTNQLRLAIGLPLRNQADLATLLQQISDPTNPNFRHYLTPEQFTDRFGPNGKRLRCADCLCNLPGIHGDHSALRRALLSVTASVANIEKALHVTLRTYQHPTEARTFFAPDVEPSVPAGIPILGISGLSDFSRPQPRLQIQPANTQQAQPNTGSGPGGLYMGNDFRAAYVPGSPLTGTGQIVGLLQFDGYTASDITYYESANSLPSVTLSNILLDGFSGTPTGNGGEVEVSLDIEMAISMSPGLSKIVLYEAGPSGNWHDILNRMATDNLAKQISCSWYQPGAPSDPIADGIFQQMAAQGQTFFTANGDNDAYTGLIPFPDDTPYTTQVGGTFLNTTSTGGSYVSETVWNRNNGIGTGGGISTQYPIPSWQTNVSMTANHGSTTMRNVPDVALIADNVYVRADGFDYSVGGTSCSAPLWAGFLALVNQQAASQNTPLICFLNPVVYTLGLSSQYASSLHDITVGNNTPSGGAGNFPAITGYDLCTGWGTPLGVNTINALLSPNVNPMFTVVSSTVTGGNGNGVVDPNECNFLSLSLQNFGVATAQVINVTLSTTTPGVTILQPSSPYPNLIPNATGSNAIPFQISTSPSFPCGSPVALTLALTFNSGSATINYTIPSSVVYAITQTNNAVIVPGVTDTGNHCDDCATTIGLPFAYIFYGTSYTNVSLSSNGNLQFAGSNSTPKNVCLPALGFDQSIFPQWQDLRTDGSGNGIFTSTTGAAPNRIFNIEWRAVYYSGGVSTQSLNFEVCLYENQQRFDIIYGNLNGNGNAATVGSQNNTNDVSQFECSSGLLMNGLRLTFQSPSCVDGGGVCQTGLLGYWTFDEGTGTVANDSSGNLNTGSVLNLLANPPGWTNGFINGALHFDGQTDVIVSNSPSLNPFSGITISTWVKADSWGSAGHAPRLLEKGSSDNQYALLSVTTGQLEFLLRSVSNGVLLASAPSTGAWHHLAATFNGSSMVLYIDGQIAALQPASGVLAITPDPLSIGSAPSGSISSFFNGALDDVRVYGRALSASEISQLYNIDTIGDGIPNWWRQQYFGSGSSTNSGSCATCDFDGTGQNNLFKYTAGLDPTNPSSAFGLNVTLVSTNLDVSLGLVASYPFNGDLTNDASGNGHYGIPTGGVSLTTDRFGNPNSALHCDGATGYVRVPAQLTGGNPFTWSVWFRPGFTATNLSGSLLNEGGAPGQGSVSPSIWINFISPPTYLPGTLDFYYYGNSGGISLVSQVRAQWDSNTWYNMAVTSDSAGNRCLYINGVCEGSDSGQAFGQANSTFYIGANGSYNSYYFLGDLDDVRVYNRALSTQEINELYSGSVSSQPSVQYNPVISGRTYTPQFTTDLVNSAWQPLQGFTGPITNGNLVTITDTNSQPPAKFYRIDISKP